MSGTRSGTQRKKREVQYCLDVARRPWVPDLRAADRDRRRSSGTRMTVSHPQPAGCGIEPRRLRERPHQRKALGLVHAAHEKIAVLGNVAAQPAGGRKPREIALLDLAEAMGLPGI